MYLCTIQSDIVKIITKCTKPLTRSLEIGVIIENVVQGHAFYVSAKGICHWMTFTTKPKDRRLRTDHDSHRCGNFGLWRHGPFLWTIYSNHRYVDMIEYFSLTNSDTIPFIISEINESREHAVIDTMWSKPSALIGQSQTMSQQSQAAIGLSSANEWKIEVMWPQWSAVIG